jgi:hypothetical protein
MTLFPSLIHCPCETPVLARMTSRTFWIRVNRLLAWSVVISPFVQIALRTNLVNGLLLDLAQLAAHAVLSLWLFGLPRSSNGDRWVVWIGVSPEALSPRGRFLMTAWRIALGLLWIPAIYVLGSTFGALALLLVPLYLPLWVLQPVFVLGHVFGASRYAFGRWRLRDESGGWVAAFFLAGMFAFASAFNLGLAR